MSVEILFALCKKRHISVHRVEVDLKYGNGYFRSLKKKEIPSNRLKEVADYFCVPVDFMLGATPESYLLWTEYQISETEEALSKESDEEKRGELEAKLEALKESLEDQRMFSLKSQQKAPPAGDGEGRYGLTPAEWKQIGHQFNTKVYSIGKVPGFLACESTGLTDGEVDEFLAGKRYVTKAQIHAMADRLGMKLEDVIMGYAVAFDGEEDEVIAAREWLRRAADQLSPELVIQAVRYLDIPEEAQQSAAHVLELANQVRQNAK